jgi:hypothetical protein
MRKWKKNRLPRSHKFECRHLTIVKCIYVILFYKIKQFKKKKTRYDNYFFSPLSFVAVFGPGSEIRDPVWVKIMIRDPG